MDPIRVLVVDDEPIVLDVASRALRRGGFEVIEAVDGASGIAVYTERRPAAVVLDMNLPDMHGRQVIAAIAAIDPAAAIICSSGDEIEMDEVRPAGVPTLRLEILRKPYSMADLRAAVQRIAAS